MLRESQSPTCTPDASSSKKITMAVKSVTLQTVGHSECHEAAKGVLYEQEHKWWKVQCTNECKAEALE